MCDLRVTPSSPFTELCRVMMAENTVEDSKENAGAFFFPLRTKLRSPEGCNSQNHRGRHNWVSMQTLREMFCFYVCLSCVPMNSLKKQKDRTLKDELPRSVGAQYATDQWRNNFRKNEEMEPKQKQHPVVNVTGDESKRWCCKQQYCIGTWNVKSTNQGTLEVVKQEMSKVYVNILGISELKWTGMGEFNSDDHYIYYCGQEFLRRNGAALIVNRRV